LVKYKNKMQESSIITCYKTVPKIAKYEGKLKKRGGSQARNLRWTASGQMARGFKKHQS
jgi:hypothetical protein